MSDPVLLAAADWSQLIIFLIIAGISVIAHIIKLANKAKAERPNVNPQPNRPRPNPELSDEVEDFLRNVKQRQGGGQGQRRAPPPRRPVPQRGAARNEPIMAEVIEAEIVPALPARQNTFGRGASFSGDAVAAEAESLGRQAQTLGAQIDQTDERVAQQLHAKFDHQLGQFGAAQAVSDDATFTTSQTVELDMAADLRQMLADPQDIRRVIVASEILSPPVDRW